VFSTKVNLSGLSLVVGLALLEVLRDYGAMGLKVLNQKYGNQHRHLTGHLD
jgi:hypothetical protein